MPGPFNLSGAIMGKVYAIEDVNGVDYFATRADAIYYQRRMGEPERITAIEAADECTRLIKSLDAIVSQNIDLACALKGLIATVSNVELDTREGREAIALMRKIDPDFVESCGL